MKILNKSDFIASIVLILIGIIFYFIIIPQEIIVEDEAILGPDLLPNICIILISFLSVLLFFKSNCACFANGNNLRKRTRVRFPILFLDAEVGKLRFRKQFTKTRLIWFSHLVSGGSCGNTFVIGTIFCF